MSLWPSKWAIRSRPTSLNAPPYCPLGAAVGVAGTGVDVSTRAGVWVGGSGVSVAVGCLTVGLGVGVSVGSGDGSVRTVVTATTVTVVGDGGGIEVEVAVCVGEGDGLGVGSSGPDGPHAAPINTTAAARYGIDDRAGKTALRLRSWRRSWRRPSGVSGRLAEIAPPPSEDRRSR